MTDLILLLSLFLVLIIPIGLLLWELRESGKLIVKYMKMLDNCNRSKDDLIKANFRLKKLNRKLKNEIMKLKKEK
ncbi:hypothetical protein AOB46_18660 [Chryseobacterium indologenes]|uniref:Uncharacterized protein n=1 Tax=Chryseobacterium indologenes TaxID=253 RepID=A0A0N0ZV68_CHRID|nr:hypothetical protein AOB46_18660 [Chryseobacterium indologenes]